MLNTSLPQTAALILALFATSTFARADDALDAAEQYRMQGDLPAALLTLKKLLQSDPDNAEGRVSLARVYLNWRQGAIAEQELNRALSLGVDRAEIAGDLARSMLQQRDHARALDVAKITDGMVGEQRAELLALQADALARMNDLGGADEALESALGADPTSETALLQRAWLEWSRGARDQARETLARAQTEHPASSNVAAALADAAMAAERFNEAIAILDDDILSTAPERWMLLYKRASARLDAGDLDGALADIAAGERLYPQFSGYQLARGRLLYGQGQYAEAVPHLGAFLSANPRDPFGNFYAGAAELRRGNFEQAAEYLMQVLEVVPQSPAGALMLAAAKTGQRDLKGAADTLQPLIDQQPPLTVAYKALAEVRASQGDLDEAIRLYHRYIELQAGDADAHVRLSALLARSGDQEAAQTQADVAVSIDQDSLPARLQQTEVAIQRRDTELSEELATALVIDYPESGPAHAAAAAAYAAYGDNQSARRRLEEAWAVDPAFTDPAFELARMAAAEGRLSEARAYYEAVLVREPSNSAAILSLAQLDTAEGHADRSRKRLENALRDDPSATDIRLELADAYLGAGLAEDARRLLQAAPPATADDPRVIRAQGQLALFAGQPFAAVSLFERLVQQTPASAEPRYLLANALAQANNPTQAALALATGFKLDPMHEAAGPSFLAVLASMPTFSAKEQLVTDLEVANPGQPRGAYFKALMLSQMKPEESLEIFSELRKNYPDDRLYKDALITQQRQSGNLRAAIETASGWLAQHPNDVQAGRQLAELFGAQGDLQRAIEAYQAVLAEKPGDVIALNNLAELLRDSRPVEALAYAQRAHDAAPQDPAVADTLGMSLLATGDIPGALMTLKAAYMNSSRNPQVGLHYVQALLAAEDRDTARALLMEISEESFGGAFEARRLLEQLN